MLPGVGERLDSIGMWGLTASLPEQVEAAVGLVSSVEGLAGGHDIGKDIDNVLVLGMGGSGVSGDVLAAIAGPMLSVPVVVAKGYESPAFVTDRTLCLAVSFSGDTEEVVAAASSAADAGARMVVLSSGGRLAELAASWAAPWIELPGDIPMPRAALGAVAIPPLVVLERLGLLSGTAGWIAAAVEQLKRRRDQLLADRSPARDVARSIGHTIPIVYGGGPLGAVAAARWKTQVNENAKAPAFSHAYPELCHNEICGWGQHGDVTRQLFTLVQLRHDHEHARVALRFPLVGEIVDEVVASVLEVRAEGEGPLAQLLDLVLFGDFVSLHLAEDVGIDPGPIPVLDDIKARLGS